MSEGMARLQALWQDVLRRVDERTEARLSRAGIAAQSVDGDHLAGAITRTALLLHVQATPEAIPTGDLKWGRTDFAVRVVGYAVESQETGTITWKIETRPTLDATAAWTTLAASCGGAVSPTAPIADTTLAGWVKDGRGWVVVPAGRTWRVTVLTNSGVMNAALLVAIERIPADLLESATAS